MKILYAASNRKGAALQLNRFLAAIADKDYEIKIAAHVGPKFLRPVDWNLNALLNIFNPEQLSFDGDALEIYYEQVKYFGPDLILSDLEPFTSYIATAIEVPIWQVSPLLLYHGLEKKYNLGLYKNYSYLFTTKTSLLERIKNIIYNAEGNFVYSHFCDVDTVSLKEGFNWIRPYHVLGKHSLPCKHDMVGADVENNRNIIRFLNNSHDSVLFTNFLDENYSRITLKDMNNLSEYACNLKNCNIAVSSGITDILADAFYNGKYSAIITDFREQECLINSIMSENNGLGKMLYDPAQKIETENMIVPQYKEHVKFLHEKLEEI